MTDRAEARDDTGEHEAVNALSVVGKAGGRQRPAMIAHLARESCFFPDR